jgi:hypothetical protein
MEMKMNTLTEYKGVISLMTDTVNEAGKLDKISLKNSNRNKPALRHTAQPKPEKEVLEFKVKEPNGFDSHPKRFKAPIEKSLLLDTEETTFRTFGNEVFKHLD